MDWNLKSCYFFDSLSHFAGMTRDDLFNTNASIVKNLVEACAKLVVILSFHNGLFTNGCQMFPPCPSGTVLMP